MTGLVTFFHILLFSMLFSWTFSLEYKCDKDICDSSQQFCNEAEKRCEACGEAECRGENSDVKFDQCRDACEGLGLLKRPEVPTSTPPPSPAKECQSRSAGMPGEQIIHYVNQIMTTIILVLVLGAIITGLVCMYRKGIPQLLKQLCKQKYAPVKTCDKMDRKPQNVDVERGYGQPQNPPSYCTEENDACLFKSASAPLFNESNNESPVCQPTTTFDSPESHPANTNFLAENQRYEAVQGDESQLVKENEIHENVIPKTLDV